MAFKNIRIYMYITLLQDLHGIEHTTRQKASNPCFSVRRHMGPNPTQPPTMLMIRLNPTQQLTAA